ncbi:hypothetical protein C8J57DRAFT_1541131 [Mycena rebaudengoi]|nr:hypothetical protein C8J57DRAFT_1541131 [Mycena rebaudengoi]
MAAMQQYGYGDLASQGWEAKKGAVGDARFSDWTANASATPVRRNLYAVFTPTPAQDEMKETRSPPERVAEGGYQQQGRQLPQPVLQGHQRRGETGTGDPSDPDDEDDSDDNDPGRRGNGNAPPLGQPRPPRRRGDGAGNPPSSGQNGPGPLGPPGGGRGGAPYGNIVPTIELKVKKENLPEWDGTHSTAIDYFWDVGQWPRWEGGCPKLWAIGCRRD